MGPRAYLDYWYGTWYPSILFEGGTKILGANFMQDHDVFFNWQVGRWRGGSVD
jgi:hypothetical protein